MNRRTLLILPLLAPAVVGCGLPYDADGTLRRVAGGELRAGISDAPPWIRVGDGEPAGIEAELIRGLAQQLGARVIWVEGPQEEQLIALKHRRLDLVAGGLTDSGAWTNEVGSTRHYLESEIRVGFPAGVAPRERLEGVEVAVEPGSTAGVYVESMKGRPVELVDPRRARLPVAAEFWQLRAWGLTPSEKVLHRNKHVLATPPGENGWLVRVEQYLRERQADLPLLLRAG